MNWQKVRIVLLAGGCWLGGLVVGDWLLPGGIPQPVWGEELPVTVDDRLSFQLFAESPQIRTPTGLAVDSRGVVFVVESHTHFPPDDYDGPPVDLIKRLEDTSGDGRADKVTVFHEGGRATMNLAIDARGIFYVATRSEIFTLRDTTGDGVADERQTLARLETDGDYPHNGLSGFAFDFSGNVYFGLGENLGEEYRLVARDESSHAGGGEGGSIFRMTSDGRSLERFATGFWNPFHLCFDAFGRLFAVDNDPDSRPPCRLLHIVEHGDYGYRFRHGRRGTHPFTSWFGELPGTLGLVAETGEAPSGVIAYESDGLPSDYIGQLLATSWGDHAIQAYSLETRGASFAAKARTIVQGGTNFRPVSIAPAPDGSLYISDWVDRSYTLHGKGRVWRLAGTDLSPVPVPRAADLNSPHRSAREAAARQLAASAKSDSARRGQLERAVDPRIRAAMIGAWAADELPDQTQDAAATWLEAARQDDSPDVAELAMAVARGEDVSAEWLERHNPPALVRAAALRRLRGDGATETLWNHLDDDDPYIRHAAFTRLRLQKLAPQAIWQLAQSERQREYAALLLRDRDDDESRQLLPVLLDNPSPRVQWVVLPWIAEAGLVEFRERVEERLLEGKYPGPLLEACLATLHELDGEPPAAFEAQAENLLADLLNRPELPAPLLSLVLKRISPRHRVLRGRWNELLEHPQEMVRREAIRSYRESDHPRLVERLIRIARDEDTPESLRAEAIAGLGAQDPDARRLLMELVKSGEPVLQRQALRSLRGTELDEDEHARLANLEVEPSVRELFERLTAKANEQKEPTESGEQLGVDEWLRRLGKPLSSDPDILDEGERIFFHPRGPGCYVCHAIGGRGGRIGPDLTDAGRVGARKLLESIVQPSAEIAPQYVTWVLQLVDGRQLTGMLVTERGDEQTYADSEGATFVVNREQIEVRHPLSSSLMPDNLVDSMTLTELRSLLAYLLSSRSATDESLARRPMVRRPVAAGRTKDQLWVGHERTGTVSVVDLETLEVLRESQVAESLADMRLLELDGDYLELLVVDPAAHGLRQWIVEGDELLERSQVPLPFSPARLALSPDQRLLVVSSKWSRRVTWLARRQPIADGVDGVNGTTKRELAEWEVLRQSELPFAPREMLWDDSSRWLLVADAFGGRLAVLDATVGLIHRLHELDGHHLHGLASRHDGQAVWVTLQRLNSYRSTTHEDVFWGGVLQNGMVEISWQRLVGEDESAIGEEGEPDGLPTYFLGRPQEGAGDPGALLTMGEATTVVALAGIHQVAIRRADDAPFEQRTVGRRPVAIVSDEDRQRAYIVNQMDDSVSVLDVNRQQVERTLALGPEFEPALTDRGEALFYDARLSLDGWYSCHSCHTDGHSTGRLNDNFGDDTFGAPKRILSLLGGGDTGPWAWHGKVGTLEEQVEKSIRETMQGSSVTGDQLEALTEFVRRLPPPPSGEVVGELDPELRARGAELFVGRGCVECHAPPNYTTPESYDVGIHDGVGTANFNPPSLRGVAHRPRLFHDNRAHSLRAVFTEHAHPQGTFWTDDEVSAMVEFLRGL